MNELRNTTTNHTATVGWQDQPDGRGTYDILKSCIGTLALLCWSSICPNVSRSGGGGSSGRSRFAIARGKLHLFFLSLLGPDFVLFVAVGQLHRAWDDRKGLQERGTSNGGKEAWNLRACYFINMGGLCIRFPAEGEAKQQQFPVTCTELMYLVDKGYLEALPTISEEQIDVRNRSDSLSRAIAAAQVLWFTVSTLARVAQGLHITSLELTTLSTVLVMLACSAAWWRKPMDIADPIIVDCDTPLSTILSRAEEPPGTDPRSRQYGSTPLSFLDRREWFMGRLWCSYMNILRLLRLKLWRLFRNHADEEEAAKETASFPNSFPSVEFPPVTFRAELLPGILIIIYSSLFLSAWDGYFPTAVEKTLWRVSSAIAMGYGLLGCGIASLDHHKERLARWCRDRWGQMTRRGGRRRSKDPEVMDLVGADGHGHDDVCAQRRTWYRTCLQRLSRPPNWLRRLSNLSLDPNLDMDLWVWISATFLCIVYCFSRLFILVEDIIGLRRQPLSTYEAIDWARFSPVL